MGADHDGSEHGHTYATTLAWSGSTGVGYEAYDRIHQVSAHGPEVALSLSSDPAFRGDPTRWNPEQLLVASASSCQLLSFLAVAARARLDVVAYRDEATGEMPATPEGMWVTRIELRPEIVLADTERARPTEDRLAHLVEVAHRECFIARSLRTEVTVTPTFGWRS